MDCGFLLHLILWEKNTRYQDIALKYTKYVISSFRSASVVFNGYRETPTTKENTHKGCVEKGISPRIDFESDIIFQWEKDVFLGNTANKQRLIKAVSSKLRKLRHKRPTTIINK